MPACNISGFTVVVNPKPFAVASGEALRKARFAQSPLSFICCMPACLTTGLSCVVVGKCLESAPLGLRPWCGWPRSGLLLGFRDPNPGLLALMQVVAYALGKPAREVLYTVVSRKEKYKAKICIDTLVVRGGDALAAGAFHVLDGLLHMGTCCAPWLGETMVCSGRQHDQCCGTHMLCTGYTSFLRASSDEVGYILLSRKLERPAIGHAVVVQLLQPDELILHDGAGLWLMPLRHQA